MGVGVQVQIVINKKTAEGSATTYEAVIRGGGNMSILLASGAEEKEVLAEAMRQLQILFVQCQTVLKRGVSHGSDTMLISEMIKVLQEIMESEGDIPVGLQVSKNDLLDGQHDIVSHDTIHLVPEQYNDGKVLNIRTWPY